MNKTFEGLWGIKATIIADSISPGGVRMTTMEIEYPRFILAELNTHRMLSKNSASSRAIPVAAMHEQISNNPATPVFWGKNQPGMQAKEQLEGLLLDMAKVAWRNGMESAIDTAQYLASLGLHKQIANRVTEPWMMMKTVISSTEWANLWHLRDHDDAQPEFHELARVMRQAYNASTPSILYPAEWHVPYVNSYRSLINNELLYSNETGEDITVVEARILSASCCAQVSYRKNDPSQEKAEKIFRQLIESEPCHASPVEHQATPMRTWMYETTSVKTLGHLRSLGVTHMDTNYSLWSGNLRGWIQFRKLIPNEAKW
jgi:thymidylate synthase ThyX